MIQGVKVKQLNRFEDYRGWLLELFREDEGRPPPMAYISLTEEGQSRGPHEHVKQTDHFIFLGPGSFRLFLWDNRPDSETYKLRIEVCIEGRNATEVFIPPGVVHAYKNISNMIAVCVNLPDKLFKGKDRKDDVDEIRWENYINNPFKID